MSRTAAAAADPDVAALLDGVEKLSADQYKTLLAHVLALGAKLNHFDYPPNLWPPPSPARVYINTFLAQYRHLTHGRCVEFYPPVYRHFLSQNGRVARYDVWSVTPSPGVSIVADLQNAEGVPDASFDVIVCTHVLSAIPDPRAATAELHRLLAPGGLLLVTAPTILQKYAPDPKDCWRFTRDSLADLLRDFSSVELSAYGNAATVAGSPYYLMHNHFPAETLAAHDPECPSIVAAAAWK
ncbi:MAG TPA: methyltransferase domain-containing protein [Azospirillaceae bacterium]|nr:methyltransferase domain-containing protein [Azospirillaceae bacterium]